MVEQIRRFATIDSNVLISGETGTGKNAVARELLHVVERALRHPTTATSRSATCRTRFSTDPRSGPTRSLAAVRRSTRSNGVTSRPRCSTRAATRRARRNCSASAGRRCGRSASVTGWTDRRARRGPRGRVRTGLRRLRPTARPPDSRSGLRRLLAVDPPAHAPAVRRVRRPAAAWRTVDTRMADLKAARNTLPPRAGDEGAIVRTRADRRLRRRAAGDRPRAQVRRPAIAGATAWRADADPRRRRAARRRRRGAGPAAPVAAARARVQSGGRSRASPRRCRSQALRRVRADAVADRTAGRPAPPQRPRRVRAHGPRRAALAAASSCWSTM